MTFFGGCTAFMGLASGGRGLVMCGSLWPLRDLRRLFMAGERENIRKIQVDCREGA